MYHGIQPIRNFKNFTTDRTTINKWIPATKKDEKYVSIVKFFLSDENNYLIFKLFQVLYTAYSLKGVVHML